MSKMLIGVHTPDDDRGQRRVLLDGKELRNVIYADTHRGIVRFYDDPPKVQEGGDSFIEHERHGVVEVYAI